VTANKENQRSMPDLEDNDEPTSPRPNGPSVTGPRGRTRSGASVTWRGIIDEPAPGDPPKHPRMAAVGRGLDGALVAVGLKRGRDDDGTLRPRKTRRLVAIVATLFIIALGFSMLHIVPAGNVLVPITLGDAQAQEGQGLHVTLPWPITQVASMSVQTQNYTMSAAPQKGTDAAVLVLGSDGASGTVDATVLYRLNPGQATNVYVNLGKSFGPKFVQPASRACVRAEFENFTMVNAATEQAKTVSDGITSCIRKALRQDGITLQAFQMRQVVLASSVQNSINSKVQAQQNQASQVYNVQAAVAKASIQRLQALATSQAQLIVACGGTPSVTKVGGQTTPDATPNASANCQAPLLTEQELEYSYIQALRDLINSPNPPTVILGSGGAAPVVQLPAAASSGTTSTTTK
jgi:regulator of protease activity HflC (stomatin/prohibitin superfamily)